MRLIDADALRKEHIKASLTTRLIDDSPTINLDSLVKHGEWIDVSKPDDDGNIDVRCSACFAGDRHAVDMTVPYCWKCGAKMEVSNERD